MKTISVDLGGSKVKMGVVSDGKVTRFETFESDSHAGFLPILPEIEAICGRWTAEEDIGSVGIAFPSLVDPVHGRVIGQSDKYSDCRGVDLGALMSERFRLPTIVENDANAAAIGEHAYGSAADTDDFVLMILGTGIGTAAFMNGRLVRGRHYRAGILFGHIPLKADGRKCTGCPGIGCAEAQASTWALPYMIRESEIDSPLKAEQSPDFRLLKKYYDSGDRLAASVFRECCIYWANCLISMICAYDPELVLLSGGVTRWGDGLLSALENEVRQRAWSPCGEPSFRVAKEPEQSVLLGLHALCRENLR